jgi:branched-chain amino acid aminotransferase
MSLQTSLIYTKGGFQSYESVKLGLLTHALHYGTGCFEGIRGFWNEALQELFLLDLQEHYDRLQASARILFMSMPHTTAELIEITRELVRRNAFRANIYLRPIIFKSSEEIGVRLHDLEDQFALIVVPFGRYVQAENGLRVCTSAWRRIDDTAMPARAKVTGAYVNSALAKSEALISGFDEAIMLSADGHVSEGSAENLFLVRRGALHTPDCSQNILEGVTRRTVIELAREAGLEVVERAIDRTELFVADEIFLTGTAIGLEPVVSVDHREIGSGEAPITRRLLALYNDAVHGRDPAFRSRLTGVYHALP